MTLINIGMKGLDTGIDISSTTPLPIMQRVLANESSDTERYYKGPHSMGLDFPQRDVQALCKKPVRLFLFDVDEGLRIASQFVSGLLTHRRGILDILRPDDELVRKVCRHHGELRCTDIKYGKYDHHADLVIGNGDIEWKHIEIYPTFLRVDTGYGWAYIHKDGTLFAKDPNPNTYVLGRIPFLTERFRKVATKFAPYMGNTQDFSNYQF